MRTFGIFTFLAVNNFLLKEGVARQDKIDRIPIHRADALTIDFTQVGGPSGLFKRQDCSQIGQFCEGKNEFPI